MTKCGVTVLILVLLVLVIPAFGQDTPFGRTLLETLACRATDEFTFDGSAGDRVVIHVTECRDAGGVCGHACFCFDQCIQLRNDLGLLATGCSPVSGNDRGRFRTRLSSGGLPGDGTYLVAIDDVEGNGHGDYALFVQRVNEPSASEALHSGDEVLGEIGACGKVDTYTFTASVGDFATMTMVPDAVGNVQPILELYDGAGRPVSLPGSGTLTTEVSSSGSFTLLAYSAVDEQGTYRLSLEIGPPPPPCKGDFNENGKVSIDELVQAVNTALEGCP